MEATRRVAAAAVVLFAAAGLTSSIGTAATERSQSPTCPVFGGTAAVNDGFPQRLSSLIGADMRTGGHECFERVVLELQGTGELPGFEVRYDADPILESPSGQPVEIAGDATLLLSVGVWMTTVDGEGYQGPTEFVPTNVVNIRELQLIENFEGMHAWAIGLDRQRNFTVSTLSEPVRIVIDIALDPTGAPPTTVPGSTPTLPPTR